MVYIDLVHNLPKGMKSAFVNQAVKDAILCCLGYGGAMHAYARHGAGAAQQKAEWELARRQLGQQKLDVGEEE